MLECLKANKQKKELSNKQPNCLTNRGIAGSSISDIMRVTGLQKGGIYNHFKSKDDLALQAFDFAIACIRQHHRSVLQGKHDAVERLQAIIETFRIYIDNPDHPLIKGGCPLLNTAIESDDAHPALRDRAQQAMNSWRDLIYRIIQKGIKKGEIRPTVDADEVATILIATLEGAVMMSKLYGDSIHIERAINHLTDYIESQLQI